MIATNEERRVIEAAQKGQYEDFNRLLRQHAARHLAVAMSILRNHEDAEEAVQDAMLAAFRSIPKFRFQSSFATWLHRITVNSALTIKSRRQQQQQREQGVPDLAQLNPVDHDEDPDRELARAGLRQIIRDRLEQLPEKQRLAVTLYHLSELTYDEISTTMKIPINTVKTHIRRGRERLAGLLDSLGGFP